MITFDPSESSTFADTGEPSVMRYVGDHGVDGVRFTDKFV
jgi:hypothetical protein